MHPASARHLPYRATRRTVACLTILCLASLALIGCFRSSTDPSPNTPEAPPTGPPVLTAQPLGTPILPGGTATLTVTATGPDLMYQWYRWNSDNPLSSGKAATLTVGGIPDFTDSVPYYCVVSNAHGSVTSDTVHVRVDAMRGLMLDTGAVVYARSCAGCHGAAGRGVAGATPPLANSDFVMQSRRQALAIVMTGTSDSLLVNGAWYRTEMPGLMPGLSLVEVAAVMTYIRVALNDSLVTTCDPGTLDAAGFPVCQKTARTAQEIAADSVSFREARAVRDSLFPL